MGQWVDGVMDTQRDGWDEMNTVGWDGWDERDGMDCSTDGCDGSDEWDGIVWADG